MPKLPSNRFEIPEAVLGTHVFTAIETRRPAFTHICVEYQRSEMSKEQTVHAVATDGHRLIHLEWVSNPEEKIPEGVMLIPRLTAKDLLKRVREELNARAKTAKETGKGAATKNVRYWIERRKDNWSIATNIGVRADIKSYEGEDYPNWRQVIPRPRHESERQAPVVIGLNYSYINDFQKFLSKYGDEYAGMKFSLPPDDRSPILIIPVSAEPGSPQIEYFLGDGVTSAEAMLMPMRI